ncbi:acyl-CoA dehydrogenase family protein, partial [Micromonospora sp. WMMD736]|uniref:acyl-CoA dehydrogenase family protein n=1 Tax=Micromonospora sp. WMMD736 TaxID=3404112 RepID=UPI003B94EFE6
GRQGWPERAGGLGGSPLRRGVVVEELTKFGCPPPFAASLVEVLGPAVLEFGSAELVEQYYPRLLDGTDVWCQGFSEPEAGSDLGALRTRAIDDGDTWRVTGQKIWTSYAGSAQRCLLLARTGSVEEGFKGISALLLDMDTPGIEVRPLRAMTGDDEFAELFLDDVRVPKDRTLGAVGAGAAVTMNVLANERSVLAWQRQAWLQSRLSAVVAEMVPVGEQDDHTIGAAYTAVHALRLRVRETFDTIASGDSAGPLTSVDKILLSTAEKAVFDAAMKLDPELLLLGDGPSAERWQYDHTYARASSIYGGTAEIQRNIVAERILGLPREK